MSEKLSIFFAESAVLDLEEIREYYADQGLNEVGERFLNAIFGLVQGLNDYPDRGRIVPVGSCRILGDVAC